MRMIVEKIETATLLSDDDDIDDVERDNDEQADPHDNEYVDDDLCDDRHNKSLCACAHACVHACVRACARCIVRICASMLKCVRVRARRCA